MEKSEVPHKGFRFPLPLVRRRATIDQEQGW
jgi:hypothetical protein